MWYFVTADNNQLHIFNTLEDAIDNKNINDKMIMHTYYIEAIKNTFGRLEIIDYTN